MHVRKILLVEHFNAGDGTAITALRKAWTVGSGTWDIQSRTIRSQDDGNPTRRFAYSPARTMDGDVDYRTWWNMKADIAAAEDIDQSIFVFASATSGVGFGNSYRVRANAPNGGTATGKLYRSDADVLTELASVDVASADGTTYYYLFDIDLSTGIYSLYRGTTDNQTAVLDVTNLLFTGTDVAPLSVTTTSRRVVLANDEDDDNYWGDIHFGRGPCLYVASIWYQLAVRDFGKATFSTMLEEDGTRLFSKFDLVEIAITDGTTTYVDFEGRVLDIINNNSSKNMAFGEIEVHCVSMEEELFANKYDNTAFAAAAASTVITSTIAALSTAIETVDVDTGLANVVTRAARSIDGGSLIRHMTEEHAGGTFFMDRNQKFKVQQGYDNSGLTLDQADGLIVGWEVLLDGSRAVSEVRVKGAAAGQDGSTTTGALTTTAGHARAVVVPDNRITSAGEGQNRADNHYVATYSHDDMKIMRIECFSYLDLRPGQYFTFTFDAEGISAETWFCIEKIIDTEHPITFIIANYQDLTMGEKHRVTPQGQQPVPWMANYGRIENLTH